MIKVENNIVAVGVEKNPITALLINIDEDACVKACICSDLKNLFVALFDKYGESTTAELIEKALKDARTDNYEVHVCRGSHDAKNNT